MTVRHRGQNLDNPPLGMMVVGPLVQVTLGPHPVDAAQIIAEGGVPKTIVHNLLVDTGAQTTVVEDAIARGLGLTPIRFTPIIGVSGKPEECPVYRMSIVIGMSEDATGKVLPATFISDVAGVASPPNPLNHVGLLGRNFLRHVRFVYDGPKAEFELIDYRHVSAPAPPKPPLVAGWRGIESARKRSKKRGRRRR